MTFSPIINTELTNRISCFNVIEIHPNIVNKHLTTPYLIEKFI